MESSFHITMIMVALILCYCESKILTIKTEDGDVIDCVHIHKQPAFDHPLLKNHRLQMRPSSMPERSETLAPPHLRAASFRGKIRCPKGTVPILRTKEQEATKLVPVVDDTSEGYVNEVAYLTVNGAFHGANAGITVWNPSVRLDEYSLVRVVVQAGEESMQNSMQVGWIVLPLIFGDNKTRLYGYWTRDGYNNTGCFNAECPGFVQISPDVYLGRPLHQISVIGGTNYLLNVKIHKDTDGNWWLEALGQMVGYWPHEIFTSLTDMATVIQWGGQVHNTKPSGLHTTTQMGSGLMPEEGDRRSCSIIQVKTMSTTDQWQDAAGAFPLADRPSCYNANHISSSGNVGYYFYLGGPGYSKNCQQ